MRKNETTTYVKKRNDNVWEFKFSSEQDIIDFSDLPLLVRLKAIKEGITKDQLEDIRRIIEGSYAMLYSITGIQSHSFTIKKGKELFSPRLTEPLIQMLSIYGWGYKFFGDCKMFNKLMYHGCLLGKFGHLKQLGTTFIGREHFCIHIIDINNNHDDLVAVVRSMDPIPAERYKPLS